ncbi:MAG TPA: hypothetical protein VF389_08995 [Woeseiaceae bacterium]
MTGPQLITAIALACLVTGAWAQDEVSEDTDPSAATEQVAERDALEPAVSGAALAAGRPQRVQSAAVMDELDLRRTEITGNQELPKVLYIVPWQKSDPGSLLGRPANTLLDEVLAPLDREEFIRQVDYYSDLHAAGDE